MTGSDENCGCKIGRNSTKYELENLDQRIREKRQEQQASLRDLATFVNIQILAAVVNRTGAQITGAPATLYESLTGEDVSAELRVTLTDQLTNLGVDVEELHDDFVSYQAVRRHLQDCLGVSTGRQGVESVAEAREVIEWARQRNENVLERMLNRLEKVGKLSISNVSVTTSMTITCEDCGQIYRVDELLEHGECECE